MAETKIVANRISQTVEFSFSELSLGNGTVALPALAWASDQDTGLYRGGSNFISVSCGGSDMASFAGIGAGAALLPGIDNTYEIGSEAIGWKRLFMMDGTAALPSFTFRNDANTGIYRSSADDMAFSAGGSRQLQIYTGGIVVDNSIEISDGSVSAPSIRFSTDPDTGIYHHATANAFRLVAGANVVATAVWSGTMGQFLVGSGSVTEPSLCIAGNQSHGFYRIPGLDVTGSTVPFAVSNGTAAEPSYSWANNLTMGFYRSATNQISASILGGEVFRWDTNGVRIITGYHLEMGTNSQIHAADGTAALPAVSFQNDPDCGMFRVGADDIGFSANGVKQFEYDAGGIVINTSLRSADGTAASPGMKFTADQDTGIYRAGTNTLGIAGGGAQIATFNSAQDANMLTLNQSYATGTVFALSANNTASGNTAADVRINIGVNDGSAGDPYMLWAIGGPTRYWTLGIDNSNSDVMVFSTTAGGTAKPGTGDVFMVAPNCIQLLDGTDSVPGLTFINDPNTGIFRGGTDVVAVSVGGTRIFDFNTTVNRSMVTFQPSTDNSFTLGAGGARWTTVHATNGTIQTSHSSTKEIIGEIAEDAEIPQGIYFRRPGNDRIHVGFLADNLPPESFYEDGVSIETSSPIGVLCANVRRLDRENKELKKMVQDLIAKLGE